MNWYSQAQGGPLLGTTASGVPFVTGVLTGNTSFYVAAKKIGCPEESLRVKITVTVIDLPTAADITIPDPINACNGFAVLSPSSTIGGAVFKYYKDQLKTQEITTGYAGDIGVTYTKNDSTGQLTISGLTAMNSPYTYYISLTVNGICENAVNELKAVTVNYSSILNLNTLAAIQGCGSVNLKDAIVNFDNSSDIQYVFFDSQNNPLSMEMAGNITASGTYYIQATSLSGNCSSAMQQVAVTVNPGAVLTIANTNVVVNMGSTVELQATSNAPIKWYDSEGNLLTANIAGPFTTTGFYTFTAVADTGFCTATGSIYVTVIDPAECPVLKERVYADTQSWGAIITGGVSNTAAAVDNNPQTFSTITTGIGLLGVGTTWQTLQWNETIAAGTPVTIKLGSQYGGLTLAGAYSVIGTKRNSSGIPVDIGVIQPVSGSLLDLLPGQNIFEFTFVPSDNSGPKDYDGVRIIVGSLVSVAQSVNVYEAYYEKQVNQLACSPNDVLDVFSSAVDLGIGIATATVGVDSPFNAVDNDINSYATMYSGAGILAAADLMVEFRTPTSEGDAVEIIFSKPGTILNLDLLSGFTIQTWLGNTPVGAPLNNTSSLLSLSLINGGTEARLIVHPQTQIYDKIQIRFGGVLGVLDLLRVHDIKRKADTSIIGADDTNTIEVCQNEMIQLSVPPQDCTTYIWYDAEVGGNIVSTGISYTVPADLAPGTYTYYIQPVRFGCEVYQRGKVTIIVGENAPETAISAILVNGGSDTTFCNETASISLTATLDTSITITNPVFYWYSQNGNDVNLIPNQNSSTLTLTDLTVGTHTYYVGISSNEYCQTLPPDRASVTITILPFSGPGDIIADNILICQSAVAVISPTTSLTNGQFSWFFTNDNSQPIVNGSVIDGVTYTISPSGTLSVSGLTITNSPYTYYVGLTSDTSCLNSNGNFKPVTITVNDSGTPTTNDDTQDFCMSAHPTVADIQVNEPNVIWFDVITGGTALPPTTALISGNIYYAAFDATTGCGSSVRLAVTVNINDAPTPTTTNNDQVFCAINNPTVANIQVNELNVTWYLTLTESTPLAADTPLISGTTYFGVLTDATSGCESSVRLEVAVTINDADTPTTNNSEQSFCSVDMSTVADIQANQTGVIWYSSPSGGMPLAATTVLVDGSTYYGAQIDVVSGCESSIRLAVMVHINDEATPTTTSATQNFCSITNPTVADIQVNETNVTWYDSMTGGTALAPTTALIDQHVYYGTLTDPVTGCESSVRLAVTVTISTTPTPTTNAMTQDFCQSNNPTIADIQINEPNVVWYNAATGGTPYAATEPLVNGTTYYAALVDAITGCESTVRLAVTVNLNNVSTPTTNDASQDFCLMTNPTVADIQVNEPNVIWYSSPTGGTPLAATTALTNGTYYGSFSGGTNCESSVRLEVTVTINDAPTPTTINSIQSFCSADNPTIASIQVNEQNVVWYAVATGGTALPPSTALTAGIYYGALIDPVTGCESTIRLAVTVSFLNNSPATITGGSDESCVSEQITYTTEANQSNYAWTIVNGTIVAGGQPTDNYVTVSWTALGASSVGVSYLNSCGVASSASFAVTIKNCSDMGITKTADDYTPRVGDNVTFTITVTNTGNSQNVDVTVSELLSSGYTFVSATASAGTYNNVTGIWNIPVIGAGQSVTLKITATVLATGDYLNAVDILNVDPNPDNNHAEVTLVPICLTVYNEFSPNNDGNNEFFKIDCIENYPNNKFEVYNRYGSLVYSQSHYANTWDGTANVSGVVNKKDKLPTGTYYYILDIGANNIVKTGWLNIIR